MRISRPDEQRYLIESMQQQFELADPPSDAISSVVFSPTTSIQLLVSSWDKVRKDLFYCLFFISNIL